MTLFISVGIPIIALSCGAIGFMLGKLHERVNWNVLIEKGILPKPSGQKPSR